MEQFILDGANMTSRADAHAEIKRQMRFPDYYGANLDALWDLISCDAASVTLVHPAPMLNALGKYGCRLLDTFFDAAEENESFHFILTDV